MSDAQPQLIHSQVVDDTRALVTQLHILDIKVVILETTVHERLAAITEARILQAREYERRLENLNGEAERLRQIQASYLPREVWEQALLEIKKEFADLKSELGTIKSYKDNATGRQAILAVVVSTLISACFLVVSYMLNRGGSVP